jgi:ABC-type spermidine/putrescine transport system permease subunit I
VGDLPPGHAADHPARPDHRQHPRLHPDDGRVRHPQILGYGRVYLIGNALVNEFLTARDWPGGAAKAVSLIILMLVAISFYLWFVNRGRKSRDVSIV